MSAEHKENGQFAKGNQLWKRRQNHGRPKRSTEEKYLKAMYQVVTVKDWRTITEVALAHAKAGDKVAREWLSNYMLGKPIQRVISDTTNTSTTAISLDGLPVGHLRAMADGGMAKFGEAESAESD